MCSDTARQHGSHLALGHTHPHLQKNTASTWSASQAASDWLSLSPPPPVPPLSAPPTPRHWDKLHHAQAHFQTHCSKWNHPSKEASLTSLQDSVQMCLLLWVSHDPLMSGRPSHRKHRVCRAVPVHAHMSLHALTTEPAL